MLKNEVVPGWRNRKTTVTPIRTLSAGLKSCENEMKTFEAGLEIGNLLFLVLVLLRRFSVLRKRHIRCEEVTG